MGSYLRLTFIVGQQPRYASDACSSERLAERRRHWPKPISTCRSEYVSITFFLSGPMQFRSDSFQSHLNEHTRLGDTHKTQLSPIGDCYRDNELGEFGSVSSYSKPNSWPRLPHGQAPHLPPTGDFRLPTGYWAGFSRRSRGWSICQETSH